MIRIIERHQDAAAGETASELWFFQLLEREPNRFANGDRRR
jgi:hypothetical protein